MYIPTQLFNSGFTPVSASGGDEIDTFTWEGKNYKYHAFLTPGSSSYVIHSGSAPHKVVIVGAGGSGGLTVGNLSQDAEDEALRDDESLQSEPGGWDGN